MRKFRFAPLDRGFTLFALVGLVISTIFYMYSHYGFSRDLAIASLMVFAVMLIASLLSMTYADPDDFVELETKPRKKRKKKN